MTNLQPETYIDRIVSNEKYKEVQNEPTSPKRTVRAIGLAALDLAKEGTKESGYKSREADVFLVISKIDSFAEGQAKLDRLREKNARRSEKLSPLRDVIEFNHAVKEMVNNNPTLKFNDVVGFITNMYIRSHVPELKNLESSDRKNKIDWFHNTCRGSLNGMRHELGFERILGQIKDVEYQETNSEDELKGIDYLITIDEATFPVDVKASETSARNKQATSQYPENVVWSHLQNSDFGDSFHISTELAKTKASALRNALQPAFLAA